VDKKFLAHQSFLDSELQRFAGNLSMKKIFITIFGCIGAFDNTSFEAMGKACAGHEVHFTILRWIAAMLSKRLVRAEIRDVSSTMMVRRGCPQRCVLSPFLRNMVINSLLVRLNNDSL
jgi:hypothetical protein